MRLQVKQPMTSKNNKHHTGENIVASVREETQRDTERKQTGQVEKMGVP